MEGVPARSYRQWEAEAQMRIAKGEPGGAVEADMVARGLDAAPAQRIVQDAIRGARRNAVYLLLGGGAIGLVGIALLALSVLSPDPAGQGPMGFGPLVVGAIVGIIALVRLLRVTP